MSQDSEERLDAQAVDAQEATPGSRRQDPPPPGWRGVYRRATQPLRDVMSRARDRVRRAPRILRWLALAVLIGFAAAVPFLMKYVTDDTSYWTNIAVKIGIVALLALGLNVVVGFAGLLDLGYVAFFAVGAYSYAFLSGSARYSVAIQRVDPNAASLKPEWHAYFWLFFFAAIIISIIAGVLLGGPTLRLRGDYLAIVTLGFGEIVRIVANNLGEQTGGPRGVQGLPHPEIGGYSFGLDNPPYYWLVLGIVVVWLFLLRRLNDSRIGRAWAAIREDEVAAAAMGVPTVRMKLWAFAIGAAVASLGGVIYASQINFISPSNFTLIHPSFGSVIILAMVVMGGMGSLAGPVAGAALVVFLPERFRSVGDARVLLFGAALVAIMVLRPQGLIPSRRRALEMRGGEVKDESVYEAGRHGG